MDTGLKFRKIEGQDEYEVIGYTGEPKRIAIPSTFNGLPVTGIANEAFRKCDSLKSVAIPDGVKKIGFAAFYGCWSLESVTMDGVKSIWHYAFACCPSLKSVKIPDGIKEIGEFAFCWCDSLKDISIPEDVGIVGEFAFGLHKMNIEKRPRAAQSAECLQQDETEL